MATKIRLKRIGRRNRPFYRMVVMDSRKRRDGAAIEQLGWYYRIDTDHSYDLDQDRILHWLGEGAEPTDAAKKLLRGAGISHRWHLMKQGLNESDIEKEMKKWELNREDVLKSRTERAEKQAKEKAKATVEDKEAPSDEAPSESKEENVEAGSDGGQEESSVNDTAEAPVDEGDSEESTEDEASSTEEE